MKTIQGNPQCIKVIFQHEFEIPEFQRPYSWEQDECDQLWDDLSAFLDKEGCEEEYFLGSIVVYPKSVGEQNVWCVIDGQQRLTTLLILIALLFKKLGTYTILKNMMYKQNPKTGDAMDGKPRINSLVLTEEDRNDLQNILGGNVSKLDKKNLFRLNYERLDEHLNEWWNTKSIQDRERIINAFQNNIVMLPIQCSTEDDALTLFQIINDRGRPLNDSDIFKAKIYNAVPENDRNGFITRWNEMKNHEDLFRLYMHISRAGKGDINKESGLRKYMLEHHLGNQREPTRNYETIMNALESCHWLMGHNSSEDKKIAEEENIYWGILETYPNSYWYYPLYVFLHKNMNREGACFDLPKDHHDEYLKLLKETLRYFFIKGVVHNTVNAVKDTTYKVCVAIDKGENYADEYRKNTGQKELDRFYEKLNDSDCGRYATGLVFLNSSLNPNQNRADYGKVLQGKVHLEHILPRAWNHYDRWTVDSHEQHINKIGNLTPLEEKVNIKASNEFFSRKKERYKDSKIQDALFLSNKNSDGWYPEDVEQRQQEALERLGDFFQ